MPFDIINKEIRTKLFGVSFKIDDIGRQQFLKIMRDDPKQIEKVYVFGTTCYVTYNKTDYVLGRIKEEYGSLLNSHNVEVKEWNITGGYNIEKGNSLETAQLGCNIILKLTKGVAEKKVIPLQHDSK